MNQSVQVSTPSGKIRWVLLSVSSPQSLDIESLSALLLEAGASGAQVEANRAEVIVREGCCESVLSELESLNGRLLEKREVVDDEWVRRCQELFVPVQWGDWRVVPFEEFPRSQTSFGQFELGIIPGYGFGTGHHESTGLVLRQLDQELLSLLTQRPRRSLDLGTGSGILSVALEKLLGGAIYGLDIDELAIKNAVENIKLNKCSQVKLEVGTLSEMEGEFDLIVSNLYVELLVELESELAGKLEDRGVLIVSGIVSDKRSLFEDRFFSKGWVLKRSCEEKGWWGATLVRER